MSTPIQRLNPDFVLSVAFELQNSSTGTPTTEAKANLNKLVNGLDSSGFRSQVRASGENQSDLLVFVKLTAGKYQQEAEKDVRKNYEYGVTTKNTSEADRLRIIAHALRAPPSSGGLGLTPGEGVWKFVKSMTPVTDALRDTSISQDVQSHLANADSTTASIKETYGVQIALYFEFLKFYTLWLVFLGVFGLASYFKSKRSFLLTYTFVNLIWGVLFITFWNRRQKYLINFWGVQNSHWIEEHDSALSKINEKTQANVSENRDNSSGVRYVKQLAFIPIALGFVSVLVAYQLGCFTIEIFLSEIYDGPGKMFLTLLPTVLISVFVPVLTIVFNIVSEKVLLWEGHDNEYSKNNSFIIKQFVLNFLTSYGPLIITSFIYLPFAHLVQPHIGDIRYSIERNLNQDRFYHKYLTHLKRKEDFQINQDRLNVQFFYFIVTNQVVQILLKYILPIVVQKGIKIAKKLIKGEPDFQVNDVEAEKTWLENVREATQLPEYNVNDDFRGLILQYGYLIIFGPVWSLAPIVSIIFNIITFKLDCMKLSNGKYFRPPIPHRVDSIHPWNYALFGLTWIGSIISPIITAFYRHGTKPPKSFGQFTLDKASVNMSGSKLILLVFLSEHIFFVFWIILSKLSNLFKSEVERSNDFGSNDLQIRREHFASTAMPSIQTPNDGEWTRFSPEDTLNNAAAIPVANVKEAKPKNSTSSKESGYRANTNANVPSQQANRNVQTERIPEPSNNYLTSFQKHDKSLPAEAVAGSRSTGLGAGAATGAGAGLGAGAGAASASATGNGSKVPASVEEKQRLIAEKQRLLQEKERILKQHGYKGYNASEEKKALEDIKDKTDSIVEGKDHKGNAVYSTMDNNDHFDSSTVDPSNGANADNATNTNPNAVNGQNCTNSNKAASTQDSAEADTTQADTTFESSDNKSNNFIKNAKDSAKDVQDKADNITNGNVTRKKTSLKKLLKIKK